MNVKLRSAPIELRAEEGADAREGVLVGYASIYDVAYRIGYGLSEEIAPKAFETSLASRDGVIPIFYQHDWSNPIGVARATEDAHGVKVEVQLFIQDNERARSVYLAAKAGALREWSIGFYPSVIEIRMDDDSGQEIERIIEADLAEASVVVRGANPATEMVSVRAQKEVAEAWSRAFYAAASFRDADPDDDLGAIAQAIDAAADAAAEALAEGDYESAAALLVAVDMAVDRLLELLGVNDPGEEADDASGNEDGAGAPIVPGYLAENFEKPYVRDIIRERLGK